MQRAPRSTLALFTLLALIAVILGGCATLFPVPVISPLRTPDEHEIEIPFETIIQEEMGEGALYFGPAPYLALLTSAEDVDTYWGMLSPEILERIREVDFEAHAVVVLFRGNQLSSGYEVVIERISCLDDVLMVDAQFWQPRLGEAALAALTEPFHIVEVERSGCIAPDVQLELHSRVVS